MGQSEKISEELVDFLLKFQSEKYNILENDKIISFVIYDPGHEHIEKTKKTKDLVNKIKQILILYKNKIKLFNRQYQLESPFEYVCDDEIDDEIEYERPQIALSMFKEISNYIDSAKLIGAGLIDRTIEKLYSRKCMALSSNEIDECDHFTPEEQEMLDHILFRTIRYIYNIDNILDYELIPSQDVKKIINIKI